MKIRIEYFNHPDEGRVLHVEPVAVLKEIDRNGEYRKRYYYVDEGFHSVNSSIMNTEKLISLVSRYEGNDNFRLLKHLSIAETTAPKSIISKILFKHQLRTRTSSDPSCKITEIADKKIQRKKLKI